MATQTISVLANAVNSAYDKRIPDIFNTSAKLIQYMKKVPKQKYAGEDYFYIPWKESMNEAVIPTVEYDGTNGTYPVPISPAYQKFRLSWKKMLGKFQLSDEMVDIQKGVHTFVNAYKNALNEMLEVFRLNLNAYVHGSGTGSLATAASYSGQVVTVNTTKYLRAGMIVDGYDSESTPNKDADSLDITAINSTTTFTCTGTVTSVDSATQFYIQDSHDGTNATQTRAPNGIGNIIDDDTGTFQNVSRSTYPQITARITDGSTPGTAQALTLPRVRGVLDKIITGPYGKIGSNFIVYGSIGTVNAFRDLLATENQPTQIIAMKGGDAEMPAWGYGGRLLPFMDARGATDNTLFFINLSELVMYDAGGRWNTHGGGILKPLEAGPALWGAYSKWLNFGSQNPAAHGRLNDITET